LGGSGGTPFERSLRPSCLLTVVVLLVLTVVLRQRLPPLPAGLLVVGLIGLICFLIVFGWFAARASPTRRD
jgi:hypothetical protein